MTTSELAAVSGVSLTVVVNIAALVWGAAKMSAKVDAVNVTLKDIKSDIKDSLAAHRELEKLVGTHGTAIALIAQATNVKIRSTDVVQGLGFSPQEEL